MNEVLDIEISIPLWCDSNLTVKGAITSIPVDFNSTLVRFKLLKIEIKKLLQINFNSTLVRFKLEERRKVCGKLGTFQFHSGAIQTAVLPHPAILSMTFQFHSGAIQTGFQAEKPETKYPISIPLWCDSNALNRSDRTKHKADFNSTLVRFKRVLIFELYLNRVNFNSTLVRFKRAHRHPRQYLSSISIPLWCDSNRRFSIGSAST